MKCAIACKVSPLLLGLVLSLLLSILPVGTHAESDYQRLEPLPTASHPAALAVDSRENLYILYTGGSRLSVYDRRGRHLRNVGGLGRPLSVAVGPQDHVFVGSLDKGSVTVFSADLKPLHQLGQGRGEFERPLSIAVAADGTVYVADAGTDEVKVYDRRGKRAFSFGGTGSDDGLFNYPTALDIAEGNGELIVADLRISQSTYGPHHGARLQVFDLNGQFLRSFGDYEVGSGGLIKPLGLTVDPAGRIMVADAYQNIVQIFDSTGGYTGAIYDKSAPMKTALDVVAGPVSGHIFIASYNADKVEVYGSTRPAGAITLTDAAAGAIVREQDAAAQRSTPASSGAMNSLDLNVYGQGIVHSRPGGIECPDACRSLFRENSPVTLTAVPASGQRFVGWDGDCSGTGLSCTVQMAGKQSVSAFFLPDSLGVDDQAAGFFRVENRAGRLGSADAAPDYLDVEGFESGGLRDLPWQTGRSDGAGGWGVQDVFSYQGNFAAQSPGNLGIGEIGYLETSLVVLESDSLSFRFKLMAPRTSTLTFRIDDQVAGRWRGESDWTTVSFDMDQGLHTLRWEYAGAENGGMAILDEIALPLHAETVNPVPDIKVNGQDSACSLSPEEPLSVTVGIAAGHSLHVEADWWLTMETAEGWQSYDAEENLWSAGLFPSYEGPLINIIEHRSVLEADELPADSCTLYFGVDLNMDSSISEPFFYDSVHIQLTE